MSLEPAAWDFAVSPGGAVFTGTMDGTTQRRSRPSLDAQAASDLSAPIRFAAGDRLFVASLWNGEHIVLDPRSMRPTGQALPRTRGFFTDMVLDDAGQRLLTLGADNEVRLYDLAARTQLGGGIAFDASGPPDNSERRGIALRGDGLQAAVPTRQGVAIWDLDPDHWVASACELAGRNLTQEEWVTYIGDLAGYRATCPQFT